MTAFLMSAGCTAYHPEPLDQARIESALTPPQKEELASGAAALDHPRLRALRLDFSKPLSDREAGVIAVMANPELRALRAREKVAEAQVFAAGLLPDPRLTASLGFPTSGQGAVDAYSAGVGWLASALITRPMEERVARDFAAQVHWDIAWQEWLVANRARLLARRVIFLERRQALAGEGEEVGKRLYDALARGVKAGDCNATALGKSLSSYLNAREQRLSLTRMAEAARQELNRDIGLPPGGRLDLAGDFDPVTQPGTPEVLFERAQRERLDLAALRAGYESQEEKLYRTVLGQYPGFTLGLDTARDTEGIHTIGVSVGLDLPLFNRNRGAIAIEKASRERLYLEYVNRLFRTRADIASLVTGLARIGQERSAISDELFRLGRVADNLAVALRKNDVTMADYSAAHAALLDQKMRLLVLDQAEAEMVVALDMAVGASWPQ